MGKGKKVHVFDVWSSIDKLDYLRYKINICYYYNSDLLLNLPKLSSKQNVCYVCELQNSKTLLIILKNFEWASMQIIKYQLLLLLFTLINRAHRDP